MEAILAGQDQARRRRRDPLRRPEGRPGDARDARGHRRDEGRRSRRRRRARHRRPLLAAARTGFCVGHVAPEAVDGGPIAFVADGDRIVIDADAHTIDLIVDDAELAARARQLEAARAALHERLPRQVRQARPRRGDRRDHQLLIADRARAGDPRSRGRAQGARRARARTRDRAGARARHVVPEARDRPRAALRHALVGNAVHGGAPARQADPARHRAIPTSGSACTSA